MTGPKFVGIVLAAGFSSRMGDLKPLMPLGRTTIVAHVVSTFHEAGVADPRVVVGHRRDEVREHLKPAGVTVIENPDYRRGMFSSVQAGVGALPEDTGAFFILPVDVPLVRPWTIRSLGRAMAADPVPVVYPVFNGRRGHPPLIGRELAAEIRESSPDISLRDVLARHEERARDMETADQNILFDVDTPDAYRELLARLDRLGIPTPEECEAVFRARGPVRESIERHGRAVADMACSMARALNQAGERLDLDLVRAAALLHDLAKGEPDHARLGGRRLSDMGFPDVGAVVAGHTDLDVADSAPIREAEVLYLADKLIREDRTVTLEDRYRTAMNRFGRDPEVRQKIEGRWNRAEKSKHRIEGRLGRNLESLWPSPGPDRSGPA